MAKIEALESEIKETKKLLQAATARGNEDDIESFSLELYELEDRLGLAWADDEAEQNGWK